MTITPSSCCAPEGRARDCGEEPAWTGARLLAIAVRPVCRSPVCLLNAAAVTVDDGLEAERPVRAQHRRMTVLTREGWEAACRQVGAQLHWSVRRANFLIEGLDLRDSSGRLLRIGEVLLQVTGRNTPCRRMDEALPGLLKALGPHWRSGVTARVLSGGSVVCGDEARWVGADGDAGAQ